MMTAGELAQLRATAAAVLPDTCTVQRPGAPVVDAHGGEASTYAAVGAPMACAIAPLGRGGEQSFGARVATVSDWVLTLPATTDVQQNDRILATVTDQASTRVFEVVGIAGPRSLEVTRRVACREVSA